MNTCFAIESRCLRTAAQCGLTLVVLVGSIFSGSAAQAAYATWIKFGSGNYNDPNNWFHGFVPDANDLAAFEVGSGNPYTVTFPGNSLVATGGGGGSGLLPANYTSSHLRVRDSDVTFSGSTQPLRGSSSYTVGSTLQTESGRGVIIGLLSGDNARLNLSHSGITGGILSSLNTRAATLGDGPGAAGTLDVGVGAFNVTGSNFYETQLIVGKHGTGTVNVLNGADVNVAGYDSKTSLGRYADGVGAVNISGAGSSWTSADQLWIGDNGQGSLTVQNGGSLHTTGIGGNPSTILGIYAGSRGDVTVTGAGSTWTSSAELRVGYYGDGTLTIADGGTLTNEGAAFYNSLARIGGIGGSSGSAVVSGTGSEWITPGAIYVDSFGSGSTASLGVLNGGSLESGSALIRGVDAGSGSVLVSGTGSNWKVTTGPLTIGLPDPLFTTGPASLTINPGALVDVEQGIGLNSNGSLNLQGGTLSVGSIGSSDAIDLQYDGFFNWNSGTLHADAVYGTVINEGGKLAPGRALAGRTEIYGNYAQEADATLEIEIGGTLASIEHDYLVLDGIATLDGRLDLALINGFVPNAEQTFTVLDSLNPIAGTFSNVVNGERLSTVDGLGSFLVNYGMSSPFQPFYVVLSDFVSNVVAGDFNADGNVDDQDLAQWEDSYGSLGQIAYGGGQANGSNFLDWQRNYSGGTLASLSVKSVPEPATMMLACIATLSLLTIRKLRTKQAQGPEV